MKFFKVIVCSMLLVLVASCSKGGNEAKPTAPKPSPIVEKPVTLSEDNVTLMLKEQKTLHLDGGNGVYTIEGDEIDFLNLQIDNKTKTLSLEAKRSGTAILTIKSGTQSLKLKVTVYRQLRL